MYRKAAKLIEDQADYFGSPVYFACHALEIAETGMPMGWHSKLCAPLKAVFAPHALRVAWLNDEETCDWTREERTDFRILVLCFMAAIEERP